MIVAGGSNGEGVGQATTRKIASDRHLVAKVTVRKMFNRIVTIATKRPCLFDRAAAGSSHSSASGPTLQNRAKLNGPSSWSNKFAGSNKPQGSPPSSSSKRNICVKPRQPSLNQVKHLLFSTAATGISQGFGNLGLRPAILENTSKSGHRISGTSVFTTQRPISKHNVNQECLRVPSEVWLSSAKSSTVLKDFFCSSSGCGSLHAYLKNAQA